MVPENGVIALQQTIQWCLDHWGFVAFAIACFIQITPIFKCNPISALCTWIGRLIVADVMKEIREIKETQKEQQATIDENEKDRIRYEVLDFANSCRRGVHHTKDEFEHVIALHSKYERLLAKTGDTNGVFTEEYRYVVEIYHDCQRENKFA